MSNRLLNHEDFSAPFMLQKFRQFQRDLIDNTAKCFDVCQSDAEMGNLLISSLEQLLTKTN